MDPKGYTVGLKQQVLGVSAFAHPASRPQADASRVFWLLRTQGTASCLQPHAKRSYGPRESFCLFLLGVPRRRSRECQLSFFVVLTTDMTPPPVQGQLFPQGPNFNKLAAPVRKMPQALKHPAGVLTDSREESTCQPRLPKPTVDAASSASLGRAQEGSHVRRSESFPRHVAGHLPTTGHLAMFRRLSLSCAQMGW